MNSTLLHYTLLYSTTLGYTQPYSTTIDSTLLCSILCSCMANSFSYLLLKAISRAAHLQPHSKICCLCDCTMYMSHANRPEPMHPTSLSPTLPPFPLNSFSSPHLFSPHPPTISQTRMAEASTRQRDRLTKHATQ